MYRSTFSFVWELVGGEWSASLPGRFTPGTHWIEGWVAPKIGLNDVGKRQFLPLPGLELRPLSRRVAIRLSYSTGIMTIIAYYIYIYIYNFKLIINKVTN
jgi:hypothetical protein